MPVLENIDFWKRTVSLLEHDLPRYLPIHTLFYHEYMEAIAANGGDYFRSEDTLLHIAMRLAHISMDAVAFLWEYAVNHGAELSSFVNVTPWTVGYSEWWTKNESVFDECLVVQRPSQLRFLIEKLRCDHIDVLMNNRLPLLVALKHKAPDVFEWAVGEALDASLRRRGMKRWQLRQFFFSEFHGNVSIAFQDEVKDVLLDLVSSPELREALSIDIDQVGNLSGETLLHVAARSLNIELVEALLSLGAFPSAQRAVNCPIHYALTSPKEGPSTDARNQIVQMLRREANCGDETIIPVTEGHSSGFYPFSLIHLLPGHTGPVTTLACNEDMIVSGMH